jgi:hypothetical protein
MAKSDLDATQREPRPEWGYWANRASFHTEAEREAGLQSYLETSAPYYAAVEANGGKPWFSSVEERRVDHRCHRLVCGGVETVPPLVRLPRCATRPYRGVTD